jgi:type IV pilus assembly protein PilA
MLSHRLTNSFRRPSMKTRRSGFTLIELLIVVVIIGILAAIAVPKFYQTKGKAYVTSIKTDLRNLVTAEEAYFYQYASYTTDTTQLRFKTSVGVQLQIPVATASGWSATATHSLAYPLTCAIFFGSAPPLAPAITEGVLNCQ